MRQPPLCDGCLQPIEDDQPWSGMDDYPAHDAEEEFDDEDDPVDDTAHQYHFHRTDDRRCYWAWAAAAYLESAE